MFRLLSRSLIAGVVAFAVFITGIIALPTSAHAQARPFVEQGSVVEIGSGSCTVGYVDARQQMALVSAHCGDYNGQPVTLLSGGTYYRNVGTFHPSTQWHPSTFSNDWAVISFFDGVQIGQNKFTGNASLAPAQLRKGERVCFHGRTSHQDGTSYSCNTIVGVLDSAIFFKGDALLQPGDSGGPSWVERDGQRYFVGLNSGWYWLEGSEGKQLGRSTYPVNRPLMSLQRMEAIYLDAFDIPVVPGPAQTSSPGGELSSESDAGTIAAVISTIVILLGLLGVNAAQFLL